MVAHGVSRAQSTEALHWPSEPKPSLVLEQAISEGIIGVKATLLGIETTLLIDTGVVNTMLAHHFNPRFAEAGIAAISRGSDNATSGDAIQPDVFPAQRLTLGDTPLLHGRAVWCLRPGELPPFRYRGSRIDGLLGMDVLDRYRVLIDYDNNLIKLWESSDAEWMPPDWIVVPLIEIVEWSGVATFGIEVQLGDRDREVFHLDTGTDAECVLKPDLYADLRARQFISDLGFAGTLAMVGVVNSRVGKLSGLQVGRLSHRSLSVTEGPTQLESNVLGAGYLRQFTCLFDFPNHMVYLNPNSKFGRGNCRDLEGIDLAPYSRFKTLLGRGTTIRGVKPDSPADVIGLRKGDTLLSIGGKELRPCPISTLIKHVTWQDGNELDLRVRRGISEFTIKLEVERGLAIVKESDEAHQSSAKQARCSPDTKAESRERDRKNRLWGRW